MEYNGQGRNLFAQGWEMLICVFLGTNARKTRFWTKNAIYIKELLCKYSLEE